MTTFRIEYLNTNGLPVVIEVIATTRRNAEWKLEMLCGVEEVISVQESK